jgi:hypothetical protein
MNHLRAIGCGATHSLLQVCSRLSVGEMVVAVASVV